MVTKKRKPVDNTLIVRQRVVNLQITSGSKNRQFFFEPDAVLSSSVITGIRVLVPKYDTVLTIPISGTSNIHFLQSFDLKCFCLTMIDKQNNQLLENQVLFSLCASQNASGSIENSSKVPIKPVKLKVQLDRCYVTLFSDITLAADGPSYIPFLFNYRPKRED